MDRHPIGHWLLLLALVAMWGSSFMLTSIAVSLLTPAALVVFRLVIAALVLVLLVGIRRHAVPRTRRFWLFCGALAITGNCLPFLLIAWAQQRIDSGLAGILMAIMPLTTLLLAHFFVQGERMTWSRAGGFVVGFLGVVLLIGPEALLELRGHGSALLYQLAALGGACCYAVNTILARHRPPSEPLVAAAGVMLLASLIMLPLAGPGALTSLDGAPLGVLLAVIALGLVSTATATVVYLRLVVVAGPTFTSQINYLIPVWALLVGMVFLGERPGWSALAALLLILGGIAFSQWRGGRVVVRRWR